jgi:hypothetical protein
VGPHEEAESNPRGNLAGRWGRVRALHCCRRWCLVKPASKNHSSTASQGDHHAIFSPERAPHKDTLARLRTPASAGHPSQASTGRDKGGLCDGKCGEGKGWGARH